MARKKQVTGLQQDLHLTSARFYIPTDAIDFSFHYNTATGVRDQTGPIDVNNYQALLQTAIDSIEGNDNLVEPFTSQAKIFAEISDGIFKWVEIRDVNCLRWIYAVHGDSVSMQPGTYSFVMGTYKPFMMGLASDLDEICFSNCVQWGWEPRLAMIDFTA